MLVELLPASNATIFKKGKGKSKKHEEKEQQSKGKGIKRVSIYDNMMYHTYGFYILWLFMILIHFSEIQWQGQNHANKTTRLPEWILDENSTCK